MNNNLAPGNPYQAHQTPQGVKPQLTAPAPAPNPPPQPTMASDPLTLFSQVDSPIEDGVTVQHYEFYTLFIFSRDLALQKVETKRKGGQTTHQLTLSWVTAGGEKVGDPFADTTIISTTHVAQGITRTAHQGFVKYVFVNAGLLALGASNMNHETYQGGHRINIGLDFSNDVAKMESARQPTGGWLTTHARKDMGSKLDRIYLFGLIMRDGKVQNTRCTKCDGKDPKRECRKLDPIQRCLWCCWAGANCFQRGEERGRRKSGGGGDGADDNDNNDDNHDDERPKRTPGRRLSNKHLLDDSIYFDDDDTDDNSFTQPKRTSSRKSSKHQRDDDDFDEAAISDEEHQPKRSRSSRRKSYRPQIEDSSDNERSNQKNKKTPAKRISRP